MYREWSRGQKKRSRAVAWYRKAAEQGFSSALFHLAESYEKGQGGAHCEAAKQGSRRRGASHGAARSRTVALATSPVQKESGPNDQRLHP